MICVLSKQVTELQEQVQQNKKSNETALVCMRQQHVSEMQKWKRQSAEQARLLQEEVTEIQERLTQQQTNAPESQQSLGAGNHSDKVHLADLPAVAVSKIDEAMMSTEVTEAVTEATIRREVHLATTIAMETVTS